MGGFIKLHRQFLEWEWFDDPNTFKFFIFCLLKANYTDKKYRGEIIKRGTFVTSLEVLSNETKISVQSVRTSLKRLESTGEITSRRTSKGTVIQIVKYDDYQTTNTPTNKQLTSNQQASNKQLTTTKKDKKDKKDKNIYRAFDHFSISQDEFIKLNHTYSKQQIDSILDDIENFKGNTKYKSLYLTANNWLGRKYPNQESKEDKTKNFINNL